MKYQFGQISRLGNRTANEDDLGVAEVGDAVLLVVADGMGGYKGGQVASRSLVKHMLSHFKARKFPVTDPQTYLKELIADAHLAIIRAGNEQTPPVEPRTTCVVCLIQGGFAWWAHVGDSRLYMFRVGKPFKRTVDHSKIEELLRKGKISEKDMKNHPQRNLVTRCVGFQQHPPVPTISDKIPLEKYDMFVLCSDGLWGPLNNETIVETLTKNTITQGVEELAELAETKAYPDSDNISVIAFRWVSKGSDEKSEESVQEEAPKSVEAKAT
ncbi:MAG: serine/threonine-protein phosphatase [Gammaproteobacteria bacterium]|nr:serine/threonine-protein phosphatase [Gammaproteobacteria bacterium]